MRTRASHPLPAQKETPGIPSTSMAHKLKLHADAGVIKKPKVEPCDEEEHSHSPPLPPLAASDDWEVTPLSGDRPFFTVVMCKSHVQKPFHLIIPVRLHGHLPEARVPAVLRCRGRSWEASYCGELKCKRMDAAAWRGFARDNGLRVGDACVFELVAPSSSTAGAGRGSVVVFQVQVLRGGLPEEIASKGFTSDEPLVIVD